MRKPSKVAVQFVLFASILIGCVGRAESLERVRTSEFQNLLNTSLEELHQKNDAHGPGKFDRWDINQNVGDLVFSKLDGTKVLAPAQIIGTFNVKDQTWLWAWANPSIVDKLKANALQVKGYGEEHGLEKLTEPVWKGTEKDAWEMTALALKLSGDHAAFRGSSGSTLVFMTFGKMELAQ